MLFLRSFCLFLLALLLGTGPGLASERVLLATPGVAAAASTPTIAPLEAKARQSGTVRVIVGLKVPFAPASALAAPEARQQMREIAAAARTLALRYAPAIARTPSGFRAYGGIPFAALEVTPAELRALAADPEVISISEDLRLRPSLAESTKLVRAPEAWAAGVTGNGQVIAIIDSGVDSAHPMLSGKVVSEACYSKGGWCPNNTMTSTAPGSGRPCTFDIECRHGTHVAGIAAGRSVGSLSGVAPDAQIIAIQVFSDAPGGTGAWLSDVLAGLERVHELRHSYTIAAANLSFGWSTLLFPQSCDQTSRAMTAAFEQLRADGIPVVVASGNNGSSTGIAFPACISSAVSVGSVSDSDWGTCAISGIAPASTAADKVACDSNASRKLSLLAPGSAITSAVPRNDYATLHGTSMAAPHVAGAFALLRDRAPGASVGKMLLMLRRTGKTVADYRNPSIVTPRVDVKAALDGLDGGSGGKVTIGVTLDGTGRGRVAFDPAGKLAQCAASCTNTFKAGTTVTLSAMPDTGAQFTGWSGACTGTDTCTLTLDATTSVAATFDGGPVGPPQVLSLTLAGSGAPGVTLAYGSGTTECTSNCRPSYPKGATVTATATPAPGTAFVSWSGACTGAKAVCTLQMTKPQALVARFRQLPVYNLRINLAGPGSGSVVVSGGGDSTTCTSSCSVPFAGGSPVSLKAVAADGSKFSGWSGACRGPKAGCDLTVSGPAAVTARFD